VPLVPELSAARLAALAREIRAHARVHELVPHAPGAAVQRAGG